MSHKIAVTGHRPQKLGGFSGPQHEFYKAAIKHYMHEFLGEKLKTIKELECISGMALGVDTYWAEVALELNIPLIAAVPFRNQDCKWNKNDREYYKILLRKAQQIVYIDEVTKHTTKYSVLLGNYDPRKMQARNEWMVNNCNELLAVWNETSGGTANCVRYAKSKKTLLTILNPRTL